MKLFSGKYYSLKPVLFLLLSLAIFLVSCDPGYNFYIRNDSNSHLIFKTRPSIESLYDKRMDYHDSILTYKVGEERGLSVYRLAAYDSFRLYGHIGYVPEVSQIPFDYIEIIQGHDTIILDTKQKIFDRLKQEGKTRKYIIFE